MLRTAYASCDAIATASCTTQVSKVVCESGVGRNPAPVHHCLLTHPFTPSLILCSRAGSVFGDGNHEVVQDFGNGRHPEHSSVVVCNVKLGVEGWRCCVLISGAGFLPHTVLYNGCSTPCEVSPIMVNTYGALGLRMERSTPKKRV